MDNKNFQKFSVLFSLYIAQAIPMSFFSTIVPVIMRQENYSLSTIAMVQLIKLPWIAKFLWAPFVDKYTFNQKDYKKWIFTSELIYASIIFAIAFLSLEFDFTLIIILVVIAFIASATQDIATDAYAILLLKKDERGWGNSMQSGGSFIGTLIGSGVLLIIYNYWGWKYLLFGLSIFVIIALIPLLFFKKKGEVKKDTQSKISFADVITFFLQKGIWKHIAILFFYYSGIIGLLTMLKPFLVDLNYSSAKIGFLSGIIGTAAAALSTFGAGWLIKRIQRFKVFMMFLSFSLIVTIYFIFLNHFEYKDYLVYSAVILLWMTYGMSTVVIYTTAMDRVRKGKEGTDFTIQIVLTHLSSLIIATQSGYVADTFGYDGLFAAEVILVFFTFFLILVSKKDIKKYE